MKGYVGEKANEGRKEGMICGREPEGREERKAFRTEGWPEQRLDAHRELQVVHRHGGSRKRVREAADAVSWRDSTVTLGRLNLS